jgi:2-haloacid dehalogenase
MITAVVFDLGNVLIDWQPEPAIAAAVGTEEARAFLDDFDFRAWNHRQDAGAPFEQSEEEAIAAHPHWREHILAYRQNFPASLVEEIAGTVDVLRDLHRVGVPVFALTNWAAETFHHARARFDWLDLFDDVIVSGEEKVAKPDPEIWTILARRTGRPTAELFFVDDSVPNVGSARAAGITATVFESPERLRADLVEAGLPL